MARAAGAQGQSGKVTVTQMSGQEVEVVTLDEVGRPTISVFSDTDWLNLMSAAARMELAAR